MNNFSLFSIIKIARNYFYILLAAMFVCAVTAFSYCHFVAVPQFSATGSLMVTNGSITTSITTSEENAAQTVSATDISASLNLANTITDILKTNEIYKSMASELNDKYSYQQLISRSSIARRSNNTLFIDITFTASSPKEAIKLVNAYLGLAPDYINDFIPNSSSTVTTTADSAVQIFPRTFITTAGAGIAGAVIAFLIIFLFSSMNTRIKDEDDIKLNYDLEIIGNIPDFSTARSKSYSYNPYAKRGE